jgi:DNA-binding NarL/FixJ family response regulator
LTTVFKWEPGFEVVGEAANGREAIELAARTQPDVMILDIAMPIMDGIEALPEILQAAPGTRVLILTAFGSERIRAQALQAGASGYLEKGAAPIAMIAAVRAAADGERETA